MTDKERYRTALLDWLACAAGGVSQPAALAARRAGEGLLGRVTAAGVAGHILDYDDTYAPGVIHASACSAPAALLVGSSVGASVGTVVDAYAAGFEAAAALARASHPQLYDRGWHPTAVCGSLGAAVAAAQLLGADEQAAGALALLRAGGLRSAFGSDGKAVQVGMAAAAGVQAARLVAEGVGVSLDPIVPGFERAFDAVWAAPTGGAPAPAIRENWIKPWPCCLGTHSTIEAVSRLRGAGTGDGDGRLEVTVHPLERQAAALDDVSTGLEAKFSIRYLAAYTWLHGPPTLAAFDGVDASARELARVDVTVHTDASLGEWEARVSRVSRGADGPGGPGGDNAPGETSERGAAADPGEARERGAADDPGEASERGAAADPGEMAVTVTTALGSPERPLDGSSLAAKVAELAGDRLDGALDDPARPAADLLAALALD